MVDDEQSSSNIEWSPKKGTDDQMRVSRRIDQEKVAQYDAQNKRNDLKIKARPIKNIPNNLKKIRTKIRDVYDDEDEDESDAVLFDFGIESSSLIDALREDEKSKFASKKTFENQKMQQDAGKMEALLQADKMSKNLGLKGLSKKIAQRNMQNVVFDDKITERAMLSDMALKTKLRAGNLSENQMKDVVKGMGKVQQVVADEKNVRKSLAEDFKAKDLERIGKEKNEKRAAKLILEKSGRKAPSDNKSKVYKSQKLKNNVKQGNGRD